MTRTIAAILFVIVCCAPTGCGMEQIHDDTTAAQNALAESERVRDDQRRLIAYLTDQLRQCRADLLELRRAVANMRAAYLKYRSETEPQTK